MLSTTKTLFIHDRYMLELFNNQLTDTVSKNQLTELHRHAVSNGVNHDKNTLRLVQTIGGIDSILGDYLCNNNNSLNQTQINQIHNILFSPTNHSRHINGNDFKQVEFTMYLEQTDNFLHELFPNTALIIEKYISHKITVMFLFIIWLIDVILWTFSSPHSIIHPLYVLTIRIPMFLPCVILCLMSNNPIVAKQILKSFEFWFKMFYAMISQIIFVFYYTYLHQNDYSYIALRFVANTCGAILFILFISIVFMMDAIYIFKNTWSPSIAFGLVASYFAFLSIQSEFFSSSPSGNDDSIIQITPRIHISLMLMRAHSFRILSIFLWKQSITMFYTQKRGNNKAIFLRIKPHLVWENQTNCYQIWPDIISKNQLAELHRHAVSNGVNHDKNTLHLVQTIGGIDSILGDYLCNNNNSLNQTQINQI
eukprot:521460_1